MQQPDGLYEKYRVFREPDNVDYHPVQLDASYTNSLGRDQFANEITSFVFVLKPDSDPAARVALAAYAEAIKPTHPRLTEDLRDVLAGIDA